MAGTRYRARLRQPDRRQDQPRRRPAQGTGPAVVGARARRAGHEHRPVPAGRGPLQADAGRHSRADGLRHAVLHPHQGHAAAPRHPAIGRVGTAGSGRARCLHGDLGRRPARRARAGRPHPAGAAGPGPRDHRRRPAVRGVPGARPARPDRRRGRTRRRSRCDRRGRRHGRHRHPAAPAPRRPGVVHGLARRRPSGARAALRAAVRPAGVRSGRVPHLAGPAGGTATGGPRAGRPEGRRGAADQLRCGDRRPGRRGGGVPRRQPALRRASGEHHGRPRRDRACRGGGAEQLTLL